MNKIILNMLSVLFVLLCLVMIWTENVWIMIITCLVSGLWLIKWMDLDPEDR